MFELDHLDLDIDENFVSSPFVQNNCSTQQQNIVKENTDHLNLQTFKNGQNTENHNYKNSTSISQDEINEKVSLKNVENNNILEVLSRRSSGIGLKSFLMSEASSSSNQAQNHSSLKVQEKYPFKTKNNNRLLRERKFPGPAGLLPDKPPKDFNDSSLFLEETDSEQDGSIILCSQHSASVFSEPPYKKLRADFNMNESNSPLNKYTVEWVKKKALTKKLSGRKIPFLAVVLHHLDHSTPDPVLVLRDPTGEVHGTLHRKVWNEMGGKLHPGAALVLRQVGVLTTGVTRRRVYLNVTMNNIVTIYSSSEVPQQVETSSINPVTSFDLLKSIDEWQAQTRPFSPSDTPNTSSASSLFKSINNRESSRMFQQPSIDVSLPARNPAPGARRVEIRPHPSKQSTDNKDMQGSTRTSMCNFDMSLNDDDFADIMNFSDVETESEKKANDGGTEVETSTVSSKRFDDFKFKPKFGVQICNRRPAFTKLQSGQEKPNFDGHSKVAQSSREVGNCETSATQKHSNQHCSRALTQAESLIFEEVMNGIDLDEFEL